MLLNILSICGKHTEQWLTVKKQEFLNLIPETHKSDLKTQCVVTTLLYNALIQLLELNSPITEFRLLTIC